MEENKEDESVKCIPDDLIKCILIRLPMRSLGRFRYLSRSWFSYLTDPEFIKAWARARARARDEDEQKLLCLVLDSNSFYKVNLTYFNERTNFFVVERTNFYDYKYRILVLLGGYCTCSIIDSSNGLICLNLRYGWADEIFYIINPLIQECSKVIYSSELFYPITSEGQLQYNGFGYDSSTHDYKIVKIRCYDDDYYAIDVFSLKNNCWTTFKKDKRGIPRLLPYYSIGEVGGVLHWKILNSDIGSGPTNGVFTFDLATNKCGMLKDIPKYRDDDDGDKMSSKIVRVSVFEGCLSETRARDNNGGYSSVWKKKEYGVTESWSKLMHIKENNPPFPKKYPICYPNGRPIQLQHYKIKVQYSAEDGSVEKTILSKNVTERVFAYKETLVSPHFFL